MLLAFAILLMISNPAGLEFLRLVADLNGDNQEETVTLTASGSGEFAVFTASTGTSKYSDSFFALEGDRPSAKIVRLNHQLSQRQILIEVVQPAQCDYHFVGFESGKLIPLLVFHSPLCYAPTLLGNGKVETKTWEGFWARTETYAQQPSGSPLKLIQSELYSVGVTGTATGLISLTRLPECTIASILKGEQIKVESFDAVRKRYLIRKSSIACGWLSERDIGRSLAHLPWAN